MVPNIFIVKKLALSNASHLGGVIIIATREKLEKFSMVLKTNWKYYDTFCVVS